MPKTTEMYWCATRLETWSGTTWSASPAHTPINGTLQKDPAHRIWTYDRTSQIILYWGNNKVLYCAKWCRSKFFFFLNLCYVFVFVSFMKYLQLKLKHLLILYNHINKFMPDCTVIRSLVERKKLKHYKFLIPLKY